MSECGGSSDSGPTAAATGPDDDGTALAAIAAFNSGLQRMDAEELRQTLGEGAAGDGGASPLWPRALLAEANAEADDDAAVDDRALPVRRQVRPGYVRRAADAARRPSALPRLVVDENLKERINHSYRYQDAAFEYRYVHLPRDHPFVQSMPPTASPRCRELSEAEWRQLGIRQTRGWEHISSGQYEPHVLLFRRPKEDATAAAAAADEAGGCAATGAAQAQAAHAAFLAAAERKIGSSDGWRRGSGSEGLRAQWRGAADDPAAVGLSPVTVGHREEPPLRELRPHLGRELR